MLTNSKIYYQIRLLSMRQNKKNKKMKTRIDHRSTNSARGRPVFANYHVFRICLDVLESGRANRFASRDDTRENVRDICHTVSRLRLFRVHIFAGKKKKKKRRKENTRLEHVRGKSRETWLKKFS